MKGVYTAQYRIAALAAAKTLMYLTSTSSKVVEVLSSSLTNESNETNEQIVCCIQRITTLGTPTATIVTPAPQESGDQAATITVKANVTALEPTYGASGQGADIVGMVGGEGASSLAGWFYDPLPEERFSIPPSASAGLRILVAPTAFDAVVRMTFREIG